MTIKIAAVMITTILLISWVYLADAMDEFRDEYSKRRDD